MSAFEVDGTVHVQVGARGVLPTRFLMQYVTDV